MTKNNFIPRVQPDVNPEFQRDVRNMITKINETAAQLQAQIQDLRSMIVAPNYPKIRQALQAGGEAQFNVQGLMGQLSQLQLAKVSIVTADPVVGDPLRQDGSLVAVKSGATYTLRIFDESAGTWNNTV